MSTFPIHAKISGPIVMIGFGSIGKGTLPLIERHFQYDKSRDPSVFMPWLQNGMLCPRAKLTVQFVIVHLPRRQTAMILIGIHSYKALRIVDAIKDAPCRLRAS